MGDSGGNFSTDLKKWGVFLAIILVLGLVSIILARPGGESSARAKLADARAVLREAQVIARNGGNPSARVNLDLAEEALQTASNLIVESDYQRAKDEAEKAIRFARNVIEGDSTDLLLGAPVRSDEIFQTPERRAADALEYEPLRAKTALGAGDSLRTNLASSVQIRFAQGMSVTLLPGSLARIVAGGAEADAFDLEIVSGSILVRTVDTPDRRLPLISCDAGRLRSSSNNRYEFSYQSDTGRGLLRVAEGRVELEQGSRGQRVLTNQRLEFDRESIGDVLETPRSPELLGPANFATFTANTNDFATVTFEWASQSAAAAYEFELSTDPYFVSIVRSKEGFPGNRVEYFDLEPSVYHWRVRSVDDQGRIGSPSDVRQIEVDSVVEETGAPVDSKAPFLKIEDIDIQGYIVLIRGRTEPDATVWVQGEKAILDEQTGHFNHAYSFNEAGEYLLEIVTIDRSDNREFLRLPIVIKD
jgi:hypothetical protein